MRAAKENKKRYKLKIKLKKLGILSFNEHCSKTQEKIVDLIKAERYNEVDEMCLGLFNVDIQKRYKPNKPKQHKPKQHKPKASHINPPSTTLKFSLLNKLVNYGLLNIDESLDTDIQKEIRNLDKDKLNIPYILKNYSDHSNTFCKQILMQKNAKAKNRRKEENGIPYNIKTNEILINEYCPFFKTKIDYSQTNKQSIHFIKQASLDRLDNSKGYVKNNVWVISRLANTIKNDASINDLRIFCTNVIKMYNENNTN